MKRSHMTRKHRSKHDNTDEGVFDAGAPAAKRKPTKTTTVRVGLSADGKASVYVVGRSESLLDGSGSGSGGSTPPLDEKLAAKGEVQVLVSRRAERDGDFQAGDRSEDLRKTSARIRSLVEYERLHAADLVTKRASSKTMEDLLSEEDGSRVRYDTALERVRGVAVLLEMAGADDVDGVKRAVADHDLDVLHVDCVNASGTSALHAAAANGCSAVTEYLVTEACVDVNATDNWGRTPLDEATRAAHHETARYLIAAGGRRGLADQLDEEDEPMARISAPNSPRHSLTFDTQLSMSPGNSLRGGNVFRALAANNAAASGSPSGSISSGGEMQPSQLLVQRQNSFGDLRRTLSRRGSVAESLASLGDAFGGSVHDPSTRSLSSLRVKGSDDPLTQRIDAAADWEVLPWDVKVDRVVGEGAFGEIRCGRWRGALVAVKMLKANCASDSIALREFDCEMSIWSRLVHPNVVQFLGVGYKAGRPPIMVCELMEWSLQQKLMHMMQSGKKITFDEGFRVATDIAAALHYMHSRRPFAVIHRDLKPANILLTHGGVAKVADFGLSRMLDVDTPRVPKPLFPDAAPEMCPSPFLPQVGVAPPTGDAAEAADRKTADYNERVYSQLYEHTFLMTGETGAYKYMAPEVFKHEFYGLKCDVYSYAMVVYEVFEGLLMLQDPVTWAHGASGSRCIRPEWMYMQAYESRRCQEMCDLVEQCWHPDPKERLTFIRVSEELRRISRISKYEKRQKKQAGGKKKDKSGKPSAGSSDDPGSVPAHKKDDAVEDGLEDAPSCKCVVM